MKNVFWIYARRLVGYYQPSFLNGGKWLIFVPESNVDDIWQKIKKATEDGMLGNTSKVATGVRNSNAQNQAMRVICVYTYDWTDEFDVMSIRQTLHNLGIVQKIPYKTDLDTIAGKYAARGNTKIAKYYV